MSNIVRRSSTVSELGPEVDNFYGTLKNIGATADNTASIAMSSAAIEQNTAVTAENTARMLYEQMETNLRLDQSLQLQNLQVQLAVTANEELRSLDSAVRVLGQTVAEIGADLKQIGRESNTLLKQGNDLLGQSLGVQTELLNTIRAEHARLEQDRKAKRLIYELEHVLERVKSEPSPLVRAYATSLMLHQTGAADFSIDDIFEVADKRTMDSLRSQMRTIINSAGDDVKAELAAFEETCRHYFRALAMDLDRGFAPSKKHEALLPEVSNQGPAMPPFLGNKPMTPELAERLNAVLASLHDKRKRAKGFQIIAGSATGLFGLISIGIVFSMPVLGLFLLIAFAAMGYVLLVTPLGLRLATSMSEIDMDPTAELKVLAELKTTEAGAAAAVAAWAEYLRSIQAMQKNFAQESASAKKMNERIRQANARASAWNQRRTALMAAVQERRKEKIGKLRAALEAFMAKYPSLRQWWTLPDEPTA